VRRSELLPRCRHRCLPEPRTVLRDSRIHLGEGARWSGVGGDATGPFVRNAKPTPMFRAVISASGAPALRRSPSGLLFHTKEVRH